MGDDKRASRRTAGAGPRPGPFTRAAAWLSRLGLRPPKPARPPKATGRARRRGPSTGAAVLRDGAVALDEQAPTGRHAEPERGASRGLTALASALEHEEPEVRARAVMLICELSEGRVADLVQKMIHDPSAEVRRAVARAAARAGTTDVVSSLIVALGDPAADVRAAAAEAASLVTGCPVTLSGAGGRVPAEQLDELKRWWKDKRAAELLRRLAP